MTRDVFTQIIQTRDIYLSFCSRSVGHRLFSGQGFLKFCGTSIWSTGVSISSRRVVYKKPALVDYFTVTNHRASKSECLVRETEAGLLIIQAVSSPRAISRRKSWHPGSKRGVKLKRRNHRQTARNWSMNNSMTRTKVCFKHIFWYYKNLITFCNRSINFNRHWTKVM